MERCDVVGHAALVDVDVRVSDQLVHNLVVQKVRLWRRGEWCQRRGKEFGFPTDFSCTTSYGTILMLIKNVGYKPVGTHLVTFSYILLHFKCNLKFLQTCWCRIAIALIRPVLSSLNCRDVMFCP